MQNNRRRGVHEARMMKSQEHGTSAAADADAVAGANFSPDDSTA